MKFYGFITWNRSEWDMKLDQYFDTVFNSLFQILPYYKVYRFKLIKCHFLRCLTPQSILEHLCFCKKLNKPGRFPFACELCTPVSFMPYETYYFEYFYQGLSKVEIRTYENLYKKNELFVFGQTANWFRTITSQPTSLALQGFDHFLNEYGCVILKIFCNSFFKENFLYLDFPQHQFMSFCRFIFTHSKKFLLQISSYINRKFFRFFFNFACPCTDYNYDYLIILNSNFYEFVLEKRKHKEKSKFRKVYSQSVLNFYKDDWR